VLQQAVALVEGATVILPIFCQLKFAQQHSGEVEVQTALQRKVTGLLSINIRILRFNQF
jgi:hypothetical protein